MFIKKSVIAISVASGMFGVVAAPAAIASSPMHSTDTEVGYITHATPSIRTRAQVQEEAKEAQRNPLSTDGWRWIGGEKGWELDGHKVVFRGGATVHADNLRHDTPRPNRTLTADEQKQQPELIKP